MITREYECPDCGRWEERVSIKDKIKDYCPKCDAKVKQVYGTPSVLWTQHNRNRFTPIKIQQEQPIL